LFCEQDTKQQACWSSTDDDDLVLSAKSAQVKLWRDTFLIGLSGAILMELRSSIELSIVTGELDTSAAPAV
jgi:hypothetical protein